MLSEEELREMQNPGYSQSAEKTLTKGAETSAEKREQERENANSPKLSDLALCCPQLPGWERKGLLTLPPGEVWGQRQKGPGRRYGPWYDTHRLQTSGSQPS